MGERGRPGREPGARRRALVYLGLVEPPGDRPRTRWTRIVEPKDDSSRGELYGSLLCATFYIGLFLWATTLAGWWWLIGVFFLGSSVSLFWRAGRQLNRPRHSG